jgi:very-short-patch-repair endonuclease
MTPTERRLWRVLRERPDDLRFRKQHPCGPYTLDFFCPAVGLVVEVDGEGHSRGGQPEHDLRRDAWLAAQDFTVLRIPAIELLRDLDAVIRHICATAASLPLHHSPKGRTVPLPRRAGEVKKERARPPPA